MVNREGHVVKRRTSNNATCCRRLRPEAEGVDERQHLSLASSAENRGRRRTVLLVTDDYSREQKASTDRATYRR